LENILKQLKEVTYLSQIIFGLDRATEEEAFNLRDQIRKFKLRNYLIQWNDGPAFSSIYQKLNEAGFNRERSPSGLLTRISGPSKGFNWTVYCIPWWFWVTIFQRHTMPVSERKNSMAG
jgi:hypothetical protein